MYTLTHTSMGKPSLTNEDIATEVARRLKRYENFNFFERFAMFMGTAQLVEISLKQLLHRKFEIEFERLERLTLGQVAGQLKHLGIRPDFLGFLESVVHYRNHMAHSILANQIMLHSLGAGDAYFEQHELDKGIYELEQLWFLYEWTEDHDSWN